MANYQSTHTGAEIDAGIDLLDNNSATQGQVLTANGTGGATWQDAKGTEVVANPSLAGTESDLTGLEVAGTKYKVSTGGSGGGTQLYLHTVRANKPFGPDEFFFASTSNVQYNGNNQIPVIVYSPTIDSIKFKLVLRFSSNKIYVIDYEDGMALRELTVTDYSSIEDVVTPL